MEKVRFLSHLFINIPKDELLYPAGSIKYIKDLSGEVIPENQNYILWNTSSDFSKTKGYSLIGEKASENIENYLGSDDTFFYLLPLNVLEDFRNMFPERSFEIYNYLNSNEIKPKASQ